MSYSSLFENYSCGSSVVQCAHLTASMGISLLQNGHVLVVGAALSFFFPKLAAVLMAFIRQNKMNAMIMKLTTEEMNEEPKPAMSAQV